MSEIAKERPAGTPAARDISFFGSIPLKHYCIRSQPNQNFGWVFFRLGSILLHFMGNATSRWLISRGQGHACGGGVGFHYVDF